MSSPFPGMDLLDLQAAFTASFDVVGYDLLIDYTASVITA